MAYHIVSLGRLTRRAADGGYAPRLLGIFVASSFFRFDDESTLPPTAANARRWAETKFSLRFTERP